MPRRYHAYPPEFQVLNVLSTAGASILAVGYLLPLLYLLWSLRWGKVAGPNPWGAPGWSGRPARRRPPHNFEKTPIVREGPYMYPDRRVVGDPSARAGGARSRSHGG